MTRGKHEATGPITNGREAVLFAIKELNRRIDRPLIERGFDRDRPLPPHEAISHEGDPPEVAYVLTRTMKLAEELGELIEAINGRMALNFRKGRTEHTWLDVSNELNDIAATAVLANEALFRPDDPIWELEAHIMALAHRAREEAGK